MDMTKASGRATVDSFVREGYASGVMIHQCR
jgi:hypothetical protein